MAPVLYGIQPPRQLAFQTLTPLCLLHVHYSSMLLANAVDPKNKKKLHLHLVLEHPVSRKQLRNHKVADVFVGVVRQMTGNAGQ